MQPFVPQPRVPEREPEAPRSQPRPVVMPKYVWPRRKKAA